MTEYLRIPNIYIANDPRSAYIYVDLDGLLKSNPWIIEHLERLSDPETFGKDRMILCGIEKRQPEDGE